MNSHSKKHIALFIKMCLYNLIKFFINNSNVFCADVGIDGEMLRAKRRNQKDKFDFGVFIPEL